MIIKPSDIHVMQKERTTNTFEATMIDSTHVEFLSTQFVCNEQEGISGGEKVEVEVDFDKIELMDNKEDGTLVGIFTDGDFRRLVSDASEKAASLLEAEVASVMTPSPMFVKESAYAAELLKVFEKKRIDDLPVCDDAGRVVGLIDIQDLPKMKVL